MSAPHADRDRSEPADRDADNAPGDSCLGFCGHGKDPGACPSGCGPESTEDGAP